LTAGGEVPLLPGSVDGPQADLLVRPESVVVSRDESPDGSGGAPGRVVQTSFLGALARVRVATDDRELLAQLPAVDAAGLGPGTPVTWRLTPTPALAVPVDG
jgi:hypothetical protein